jgi:hypothetical protein
VLASEVLREDLAPYRPAERSGRLALGSIALALTCLGVGIRFGLGPGPVSPDASSLSFAAGGAALASALLPFPYALRAAVSTALGVALLALGLSEAGPLAALGASGPKWQAAARFGAMTILPAALFFRATYRAYRPARACLAVAVLLAMPFAWTQLLEVADGVTPVVLKAGALFNLVVVLCGLLGFMGQDTTGGGALCASVQIGVMAGDLALGELAGAPIQGYGPLTHGTTAAGLLCAAALASIGLFQMLSGFLAGDARRASLHADRSTPT